MITRGKQLKLCIQKLTWIQCLLNMYTCNFRCVYQDIIPQYTISTFINSQNSIWNLKQVTPWILFPCAKWQNWTRYFDMLLPNPSCVELWTISLAQSQITQTENRERKPSVHPHCVWPFLGAKIPFLKLHLPLPYQVMGLELEAWR